jgi:hypothetical protein
LRYEVEAYEESKQRFPKVGSRIETEVGNGTIERIDIFKSEAVIRTDEGGWIRYSLKDIEEEETEQKQAEAAEPADTGEEADSSEEPHIEDETAPEIDDEEPDSEGQGADEAEASASSEQVDNKQQSRSRRRGRSRRRRNRSDQRSDSN